MKLPSESIGAFSPSGSSLASTKPAACGSRVGGDGRPAAINVVVGRPKITIETKRESVLDFRSISVPDGFCLQCFKAASHDPTVYGRNLTHEVLRRNEWIFLRRLERHFLPARVAK